MTVEAAIEFLNNHYEYETTHRDAAAEYTVVVEGILFENGYDVAEYWDCDNARFGVQDEAVVENEDGSLTVSVYLGQQEMECQLPEGLSVDQIAEVEEKTGWVNAYSNDLFYHVYPDISVLIDVNKDVVLS